MKDNFTHVCFIIDESGSMYDSIKDVKGGFKKIIEEQKSNTTGQCAVSMYTFDGNVTRHFVLQDVNKIDSELSYVPGGSTALNDAVGKAIDEIGEKLAALPEEERPSSNLIVIMTDGGENSSRKYSIQKVRDMIAHQTNKYSWTFMYLGADITTADIADSLGIKYRAYSTKKNLENNYSAINSILDASRSVNATSAVTAMDSMSCAYSKSTNTQFAQETGIQLKNIIE